MDEREREIGRQGTLLAELVRRQTASGVVGLFTRTIDKAAEEMAQDLMREPEFREQMRTLIREAFAAALRELQQPAPAPPEGRR